MRINPFLNILKAHANIAALANTHQLRVLLCSLEKSSLRLSKHIADAGLPHAQQHNGPTAIIIKVNITHKSTANSRDIILDSVLNRPQSATLMWDH